MVTDAMQMQALVSKDDLIRQFRSSARSMLYQMVADCYRRSVPLSDLTEVMEETVGDLKSLSRREAKRSAPQGSEEDVTGNGSAPSDVPGQLLDPNLI